MNPQFYPITVSPGVEGTVEITEGRLTLEFPPAAISGSLGKMTDAIKRYHFCLLTPNRENVEFELYRFSNGEWWEWWMLQLPFGSSHVTLEIKDAAKKEMEKRGI